MVYYWFMYPPLLLDSKNAQVFASHRIYLSEIIVMNYLLYIFKKGFLKKKTFYETYFNMDELRYE